jgi:hypothetical protein
MINQNPEQNTLDRIDRLLADGGWVVQDFKEIEPRCQYRGGSA